MLEDGFSSSTRSCRVARLNDEIALDKVKQVEVKSLHFAEFEKIEAAFGSLFHVQVNGDVTQISLDDDRHRAGSPITKLGKMKNTLSKR